MRSTQSIDKVESKLLRLERLFDRLETPGSAAPGRLSAEDRQAFREAQALVRTEGDQILRGPGGVVRTAAADRCIREDQERHLASLAVGLPRCAEGENPLDERFLEPIQLFRAIRLDSGDPRESAGSKVLQHPGERQRGKSAVLLRCIRKSLVEIASAGEQCLDIFEIPKLRPTQESTKFVDQDLMGRVHRQGGGTNPELDRSLHGINRIGHQGS